MIDAELLKSLAAIAVLVALALWVAPPRTMPRLRLVDTATVPIVTGLAVGRVVAMTFEDSESLPPIRDLLILRGGVELWPAVAAGTLVAMVSARRADVDPASRVADAAPYALVAYAAYEAACLFRSGCFGPPAALGLEPPGTSTSVVPVGVLVAGAVIAVAVLVRRCAVRDGMLAIMVAISGLAAVRSIASIWLPKVGLGPTRQHVESIAVAAVATSVAGLRLIRRRRALPRAPALR